MNKERRKDQIIEIVKKAIDDNTIVGSGEDDIIAIDCNDVDHIAEEVAENVYNFYKPIDNEPVGALGKSGISVLVTKPRRLTNQILEECAEAINENRDLRRKCERLQAKNAGLKRTNEAIQKATAKNIADWIAFRAFHGGYAELVQNVLSELSDLIKRNYGVEVKNDD